MNTKLIAAIGICLSIACAVVCSLAYSAGVTAGQDEKETPEFGELGKVTLTPNKENVVASELLGKWVYDAELTGRIAGGEAPERDEFLHFTENEDSSKRIIKQMGVMLEKLEKSESESDKVPRLKRACQTIYLAGKVEYGSGDSKMTADFALTTLHGNPKVMVYEPEEDDFESVYVMLARDEKGDNDVLFLGGDFNNETFRAFRKVKE